MWAKQKCYVYNFVQCIYIHIGIYWWTVPLRAENDCHILLFHEIISFQIIWFKVDLTQLNVIITVQLIQQPCTQSLCFYCGKRLRLRRQQHMPCPVTTHTCLWSVDYSTFDLAHRNVHNGRSFRRLLVWNSCINHRPATGRKHWPLTLL